MLTCTRGQVRRACSGEWWVRISWRLTVVAEGDADLDQHIDRQAVEQAVVDARAQLESDARITRYLPVLVTRRAIDDLTVRGSGSATARI